MHWRTGGWREGQKLLVGPGTSGEAAAEQVSGEDPPPPRAFVLCDSQCRDVPSPTRTEPSNSTRDPGILDCVAAPLRVRLNLYTTFSTKRLVFLYFDGGSAQRPRFTLKVKVVLPNTGLCPLPSSRGGGETEQKPDRPPSRERAGRTSCPGDTATLSAGISPPPEMRSGSS